MFDYVIIYQFSAIHSFIVLDLSIFIILTYDAATHSFEIFLFEDVNYYWFIWQNIEFLN
jgi:hypothetical protein